MATLWGYLDPAEHAHMLLDEPRVSAYARAIAAVVRPGDVVLDVGTGTGVLAILAAKAGARKVYAVDRTGVVELAKKHVVENGVAGVVEVIRADLLELDALPEPARVIVGEQLGNFAPAEAQHQLYASARRLAIPDAVMIPSRYRLVFGAVRAGGLREDCHRLANVEGVSMGALVEKLRSRVGFEIVDPTQLLGDEVEGDWIAADATTPTGFAARVPIATDGEVGAISCGFTAELAPGVLLRTAVGSRRTHWSQTIFPVHPPLPVRAGDVLDVELLLRVATNVTTWAWTVRRGADERAADAMGALVGETKADLLEALQLRGRE
jgi:protein arginine N-methyltransferase 6